MTIRERFDKVARRWWQEFDNRDDQAGDHEALASRWQRYLENADTGDHSATATLTTVDDPRRRGMLPLVVEQRVTNSPGNFGLEAWVHYYEHHV